MVERWGFEDPACGVKRVSVRLVRKGTKKRKEKNITCMPMNEAMVMVGVGSVVTAQANVFAILGNKIVKNLKVFVEVDYLRSWGVLCQP